MSHPILSHLQANDGATLEELVAATGHNADAVRQILSMLVDTGFVIGLPGNNRPPKFYAIQSLGECEWCGRFDHHRVAGMCPKCLAESSGLESLPTRAVVVHLARPATSIQRSHT